MLVVYGARTCPDCIELKKNFDYYKIEYSFVDIQENTKNLKLFLQMRDSEEFYAKAKAKGLIGIPTLILDDGTKTFYWKKYMENLGFTPLSDEGLTCDAKSKSC